MVRDSESWRERASYHDREIQRIKRRLKEEHGGVFDRYLGLGSMPANGLRLALEKHRVAYWAARNGRNPYVDEIADVERRFPWRKS